MQVYHNSDTKLVSRIEQLFEMVKFAVDPAIVFRQIEISVAFAPVATDLHPQQVCVPFPQSGKILPAGVERGHESAQRRHPVHRF